MVAEHKCNSQDGDGKAGWRKKIRTKGCFPLCDIFSYYFLLQFIVQYKSKMSRKYIFFSQKAVGVDTYSPQKSSFKSKSIYAVSKLKKDAHAGSFVAKLACR